MSKRVIEHEIKVEKSVKFILAALAFGVIVNAFGPSWGVKDARAALSNLDTITVRLTNDDRYPSFRLNMN
tara:strand:- start:333 stop:542 length:210 start_codon:yes stop_codon:yes gene_type:complete